MKSVPEIAPPPAPRRHRPLPLEPFVFAMFLTALTLGINVLLPRVETGVNVDTTQQAPAAQPAQVAQAAQVN